ncbi:23S rRNA (pseudouridine(1915)-N(3))-methyltransferase RlmH [Rhodoplanes sp. TEM]|uniref:Ribosomal RNA large subunit methyltransferase H n=1 Tax=Rhodoplanes tepidamans TaxID=200616 RepID=A0ABT5J3S9_RHOTP|nr:MULTISPECIES: 23S rRNA (pseudouridine(1915)-N(3))-methyltransferase RlmH [Rhodoplanes]MDC7784301.1 23S rRNA (pseudouridine(1915)-N(3))-methyltransferase RlmH [Rhodoplanes tepidamans]MDC7983693.1 23S rRNA (pseudouridine(1915)-N(3))-methyltransferase RlmH [Rhodoplanes sp. TEM]MDQ0353703.1 23S rRNA (pseudouridine1915-N3)-methyltransferase [Rhodoplanes tepidamans]
MRLVVAAVGRMKSGGERDLADRYLDRLVKSGRAIGLRGVEVVELRESRAQEADRRRLEEAIALANVIPDGAAVVALDERGQNLDSAAIAGEIRVWRDSGRDAAVFVVGGADGLGDELRRRADLVLSFGAATWPHQLVRVMLLEQLYRASTILSGHPYHRA